MALIDRLRPATLTWPLRRRFWNAVTVAKYRSHPPDTIRAPRGGRYVASVPLGWTYPSIAVRSIVGADRVPSDEAFRLQRLGTRALALLRGVVPPMEPSAAPIAADPGAALDDVYTPAHRRCYPRPVRPAELDDAAELGAVALASPYACYLTRANGAFRWDFGELARYDVHPGLRSPAAVVDFAAQPDGALRAERIRCEAGDVRPGEPDWPLARRLAMCAAANHLSLVRHFGWIHLAAGAAMAIATRNALPADHRLRRLLWPHVYGTAYSNEVITIGNLARGGDFESIFTFTRDATLRLLETTFDEFRLEAINPRLDAARRGITGAGFATPALDNRIALYDVIERHCARYLARAYPSDDALAADRAATAWLDALERALPNGVGAVAGEGVTVDGLTRLAATLIYLASVEHEIVGSGVWDYQAWPDEQPVRVARDGSRMKLDVYQRLVNANFTLNVHRTSLLTDFSGLALDEAGADAFRRFRAELLALQDRLDREPPQPWRMEPRRLKANINA